jgi:flagellar assembly protein FliH
MGEIAKFQFDNEFVAEPSRGAAGEHSVSSARNKALAAARAEGHEAALAQARAEIATTVAVALENMIAQVIALRGADEARDQTEMVRFAYAIGAKLAAALIGREPAAEVELMIKACLADLRGEPRIVVRAAAPVVDQLKSRIDSIATDKGFTGAIVLLPDDGLTGADCRVEWADGGAERDGAHLNARIEAAISRYLQQIETRSPEQSAAMDKGSTT